MDKNTCLAFRSLSELDSRLTELEDKFPSNNEDSLDETEEPRGYAKWESINNLITRECGENLD